MSKQQVTNTWKDGLNKDLNPLITPNTVLTDNLNGTLITYNGNEFSLQNDMGNINAGHISDGFYPIGIAEHGGVLYIASINDSQQTTKYKTENANNYSDEVLYDVIKGEFNLFGIQLNNSDVYNLLNDGWTKPYNASVEDVQSALEYLRHPYNEDPYLPDPDPYIEENYTTEAVTISTFELGSYPSLPENTIEEVETAFDTDVKGNYVYRPLRNLITKEWTEVVDHENPVVEWTITWDTTGLDNWLHYNVHYDGSLQEFVDVFYDSYASVKRNFSREDAYNLINSEIGKWTTDNEEDILSISNDIEEYLDSFLFSTYDYQESSQIKTEQKITTISNNVYSISLHMTDETYIEELVDDLNVQFENESWFQGNFTNQNIYDWIANYNNDQQMFTDLSENVWSVDNSEIVVEIVNYLNTHNYVDTAGWFGPVIQTSTTVENVPIINKWTETIVHGGEKSDFRTSELNYNKKHPVTIEVQLSYDGSINLILNDNFNPPRLINSGFAVTGNGKGKFIKHHYGARTNYYDENKIDAQTRLIQNSTKFTYIDLGDGYNGEIEGLQSGGQLKGGNYTFYLRYGDADRNKTDIICESGVVSVFHGTPGDPFSITGAFQDELTDKMVYLTVRDIDDDFSKIYLSYTREYCDSNGYRLVEAKSIVDPYTIDGLSKVIIVTGLETTEDISIEDLNIKYHTVSKAKAIAQQQDMLFLGNTGIETPDNETLQNLSYQVKVTLKQDESIGYIDPETYKNVGVTRKKYTFNVDFIEGGNGLTFLKEQIDEVVSEEYSDNITTEFLENLKINKEYSGDDAFVDELYRCFSTIPQEVNNAYGIYKINSKSKYWKDYFVETNNCEYYSSNNIYYKLGYWPGEIYRFGIVYIKSDGTTTPVYDLKGCRFEWVNDNNFGTTHNNDITDLVSNDSIFLNDLNISELGKTLDNTRGVFQIAGSIDSELPLAVIRSDSVKPLYLTFELPTNTCNELSSNNIIGYYIVRQKRIPITLCEGLSAGISSNSFIPMLYKSDSNAGNVLFDDGTSVQLTLNNITTINGFTSINFKPSSDGKELTIVIKAADTDYLDGVYEGTDDEEHITSMHYLKGIANEHGSYYGEDAIESNYLLIKDGRYIFSYNKIENEVLPPNKYFTESLITNYHSKSLLDQTDSEYSRIFTNNSILTEGSDNHTYIARIVVRDNVCVTDNYIADWNKTKQAYAVITFKSQGTTIGNVTLAEDWYDYIQYIVWYSTRTKHNSEQNALEECYKYCTRKGLTIDKTESIKTYNTYVWWARYSRTFDEDGYIYSEENTNNLGINRQNCVFITDTTSGKSKNLNTFPNLNYNLHNKYEELSSEQMTRWRSTDLVFNNAFALLSKEVSVNPELQSKLNGIEFNLVGQANYEVLYRLQNNDKLFTLKNCDFDTHTKDLVNVLYIPSNTSLKTVTDSNNSLISASTIVGDKNSSKPISFLYERPTVYYESDYRDDIIRGIFTDYSLVYNTDFKPNKIYSVCIPNSKYYENEFITRGNNNDEYYVVSNKSKLSKATNAFKGDCYTNTVTVRMINNFIDPTAPISDNIVDKDCWKTNYKGYYKDTDWSKINVSDANTVDLGHWVTFKCLSSINLALRSEDKSNVTEYAMMGNPRSFYPHVGASTATGMKVPDTTLFNHGYDATVSRIRHSLKDNTPYDRNEFGTRVLFSNVAITDSFQNGYRTFQGLSYKDYPTVYGDIVKLLPWGQNLFCVFEHGIAIITVNPKALINTTTEDTIHIYGYGVLPNDLSVISQDFGSVWADSVIKTPLGIYGVDTSAKKIWQYTDAKGLVTISDMKIQRFLNDEINLGLKSTEDLGVTNVKTHYNEYKGDVMFTFYNGEGNNRKEWNICYNERQGLWITRYSWLPLLSANADNTFYSIELHKADDTKPFGIWKHGRTGIDRLILPTNWYSIQYPFEFEFVAGEPLGIDKIFENLKITSNNVQPEKFYFQIIGDDYLFNKARIYHDSTKTDTGKEIYHVTGKNTPYNPVREDPNVDTFTKQTEFFEKENYKPVFYNACVTYDKVLDEYTLVVEQECKNKEKYGVRLGNIQYKENGWDTNIEPLRYNTNLKNPTIKYSDLKTTDSFVSAKLRDKWIKIRIKYKGDRLAIIGAVTTFENTSYA